jgi:glycosyltransferase involved in cell wall biosynthesis
MKKTLLICEKYPLPEQFGGGMRTMNFVRFFSAFSQVDIAYQTASPGLKGEDTPFTKEYLLKRNDFPRTNGQHFGRALRGIPYPAVEYSNESRKLLTSLILSGEYDYIFFRHLRAVGNLVNLISNNSRKVILDFDDLLSGSLYELQFYRTRNMGKKLLRFLNRLQLWKYELKCQDVGAALFCSKVDSKKIAGKNGKRNVFVVPNVYDQDGFHNYAFGDGYEKGNILLFLGSLDYEPNIEGLKWFLKTIYEEFRKRYADCSLMIVGKAPTPEVLKLTGGHDAVAVYADVPDVKEYYKRCRAMVVPLLSGGGTRIKILEAALAERPVLSTPIGAQGLDLENEKEIFLFRNAGEFCSGFEKLSDRPTYSFIASNFQKAVALKYSREVFNASMRTVVDYLEGGKEWKI